MHDIYDPNNILDRDVAFSPHLVGKECIACGSAKLYKHFRADSSFRDGRRDMCLSCEASPRLSTIEHTHRLREMNNSHAAVSRQQLRHQDDYQVGGREGRRMHHSEFIVKLRQCVPNVLVLPGAVIGDLAIYRVYGEPQRRLEGMSFEYLGYLPMGHLYEFNQYEFDDRDVPIKETRGWRTPLLRFIKLGLMTEKKCDEVFGRPTDCPASTIWFRTLYEWRNQKSVP